MARLNGFEYINRSRGCDKRALRRRSRYDPVFTRQKYAQTKRGPGRCVWCRRRFRRALRVFSRPAARLGPLVNASTNLGAGRAGGWYHAVVLIVAVVSRRRWLRWCLIHRADDPSFDASVAWAHWSAPPEGDRTRGCRRLTTPAPFASRGQRSVRWPLSRVV